MKTFIVFHLLSSLPVVAGFFSRWFKSGEEQDDPDLAVLSQLHQVGSNLARPHTIDFFLYFPDQKSAEEAAVRLRDEGCSVEIRQGATGSDWLCASKKYMVPSHNELKRLRLVFNGICQEFGGEYDGWGAEVVN